MITLKPEDITLLKEILATPTEQLINDFYVDCQVQDFLEEENLKDMINDYKRWSKKTLNDKNKRTLYLSIINELNKELEDVRAGSKTNPHRRRVMGYRLGRHNQEDRNAGNTINHPAKAIPPTLWPAPKRVYGLGRKNKPG
jgi:hypothetical protein